MRPVLFCFAVLPLCSQAAKPAKPVPPSAVRPSATPRDFQLAEPSYKFPTQIKQALVQFVQPVPQLVRDYQAVYADKQKFSPWLKGVLLDRKASLAKARESGPTVLSSDLSKLSTRPAVITSTTTKVRTQTEAELGAIERYLAALKAWAPD